MNTTTITYHSERKPSTTTPSILPYRDDDNSTVRYFHPETNITSLPMNATNTQPNLFNSYDSDLEPLVHPEGDVATLTPDDIQRFTATGRPMPAFKASSLANIAGDIHSVPQLLPKRYTDESIIPAIVINVIPSPKPSSVSSDPSLSAEIKEKPRRHSFLAKLKPEKTKSQPTSITKVIYMPRGEYLKYFARDRAGAYIGTEPYRDWTENELEEAYGKYRPVEKKDKRAWASFVF